MSSMPEFDFTEISTPVDVPRLRAKAATIVGRLSAQKLRHALPEEIIASNSDDLRALIDEFGLSGPVLSVRLSTSDLLPTNPTEEDEGGQGSVTLLGEVGAAAVLPIRIIDGDKEFNVRDEVVFSFGGTLADGNRPRRIETSLPVSDIEAIQIFSGFTDNV